ncbi:MAG TPA: HEPN domain-containing protein [Myxococcota bacterium]|nr:HEPN domain-containing protein [Myxococcota bacterium]
MPAVLSEFYTDWCNSVSIWCPSARWGRTEMGKRQSAEEFEPSEPHGKRFFENLEEFDRLLSIHEELTGAGPGRRHGVEVLNKSAVVLLTACWEAYVEDLAVAAFDELLQAKSPDAIPPKVRAQVCEQLNKNPNATKPWSLAGDGWRNELRAYRDIVIDRHLRGFNTPKSENVDALFSDLIGLRALSSHWNIGRFETAEDSRKRLDDLVILRGDIAHRVKAARTVRKTWVRQTSFFIARLAGASSLAVEKFIKKHVGHCSWASESDSAG